MREERLSQAILNMDPINTVTVQGKGPKKQLRTATRVLDVQEFGKEDIEMWKSFPASHVGGVLSFRFEGQDSVEDNFIYMLFCFSHTRQVNGRVI